MSVNTGILKQERIFKTVIAEYYIFHSIR